MQFNETFCCFNNYFDNGCDLRPRDLVDLRPRGLVDLRPCDLVDLRPCDLVDLRRRVLVDLPPAYGICVGFNCFAPCLR